MSGVGRFLVLLVALAALSGAARAQETSAFPEISVAPEPIRVYGVRCSWAWLSERLCRSPQRVELIVYMTAEDLASPLPLTVVKRQLVSEDGRTALPLEVMRLPEPAEPERARAAAPTPGAIVAPPAGGVAATGAAVVLDPRQGGTLPVTFHIAGTPPGAYLGAIIAYGEAGRLIAPVSLSVKRGSFWAIVVLVLGVAIGLGASYYVANSHDSDQTFLKIERLREQADATADIHPDFKRKIETKLRNAYLSLHRDKPELADEDYEKAERAFRRWLDEPDRWSELLGRVDLRKQEIGRLLEDYGNAPFTNDALDGFERVREAVVISDESYTELKDRLDETDAPFVAGLRLCRDAERLRRRMGPASEADPKLAVTVAELCRRLRGLSLTDAEEREAIEKNLRETLARFPEPVGPADEPEPRDAPATAADRSGFWSTVGARVRIRRGTGSGGEPDAVRRLTRAQWARRRRTGFIVLGYLLLMVILAGAGFDELYAQDDDFGAQGFMDYVALFVWGFGSEATRSSVTKLFGGLGFATPARSAG